ncbi:hypothetical protein OXX79_010149 [Metschnikowia pulcherrima]
MRLLRFMVAAVPAMATVSLYESAMAQLDSLPYKYEGKSPIYTHHNLHRGINVPQYDPERLEYTGEADLGTHVDPESQLLGYSKPLESLILAADQGSPKAAAALGDIYTFGNYSVPTNYTRALEYYAKAAETDASGHVYFMMGYMHSTGMFGELPVDKQRAKVYYEFAARNGDTNALLVLAYQALDGVDGPADCETAQVYYSRLARHVIQYLEDTEVAGEAFPAHNINLADFHGGLYGEKISESESSVLSEIDNFVQFRDSLRDRNLESPDSQILELYFDALSHFHGGYFSPRNTKLAFREALECAMIGQYEYDEGKLQNPASIDRLIWKKCQGLVGRMYLQGEGTERNVSRAHFWLNAAIEVKPDKENLLDMALLRKLDPTPRGESSPMYKQYLQYAATNGSIHGMFLFARDLITKVSPFDTVYVDSTYDLIRSATSRGHYEATFYFADAVESGFSASKGESFSCADLVSFYKNFVDRSETVLFPHLSYAFEELSYGNYKNALLGYSIAAEQGLLYSQISAAFLLYQMEPLLPRNRKSFSSARVQSALKYLDLASQQGHIDSTILLGDIYAKGLPGSGLEADYEKALAYYTTAASAASPHACYKLGSMYEYALGLHNKSADYYMAKRYYDLSSKYYSDLSVTHLTQDTKPNTYAISFALLRLRLKLLFSRSEKRDDAESSGWLGTLKKLAKQEETEAGEKKATSTASENDETESLQEKDDYQLFDYVVLGFTLAFFAYVGFQNMRGQLRRLGQQANNANAGHANGADRRRFRVEFFFAI